MEQVNGVEPSPAGVETQRPTTRHLHGTLKVQGVVERAIGIEPT
jgi:hypothetical protein